MTQDSMGAPAALQLVRRLFGAAARPELLLILISAALYLGNGETLSTGDTLPARHLPLSILRDHDFYLDEIRGRTKDIDIHSLRPVNGHWVSEYPVGAAILAVPFYVPAAIAGIDPDSVWVARTEKLAATGIVLLSVIALWAALRLAMDGSRRAVWVAGVYALCTSSLSISSQALWQHGASQLAIAAGIYCLVRGLTSPRWVALAGLPLALAVVCRPTNLLMVAPLALYVLVYHTKKFPAFTVAAAPAVAFQIWYNLTYFGTALHSQFSLQTKVLWTTPFLEGLAGLLISPGRGLFIYSPILLFSIWGAVRAWRSSAAAAPVMILLRYASIGVPLVVISTCKWWSWWGGLCYGPRLLADALPLLCLGLVPVVDFVVTQRVWRWVAGLLAVLSFGAHFQGAYWDDGHWTGYVLPDGMWSWSESPLVIPTREIASRLRIRLFDLPTSRSDSGEPAASYWSPDSSGSPRGQPGAQIPITVEATNTGHSIWLAWPKKERGTVALEWHLKAVDASPGLSERWGRTPLRCDVYPGSTYEFQIPVVLPPAPGAYTLVAGLVTNPTTLPVDSGSALRVPVFVRPVTRGKWHDAPAKEFAK